MAPLQNFGGLTTLVLEPVGDVRGLLVLLHGLTFHGEQLVPLAHALLENPALRGCRIAVPHAPVVLSGFAEGLSWWPVSVGRMLRQRGRGETQDLTGPRPPGMDQARAQLAELVRQCAPDNVPLALVGFSQGAMLTMDYALKEPRRPNAIALIAGTIVGEVDWLANMPRVATLPVLMTHGRADDVLPFQIAERLRDQLTAAGADVTFLADEGGHEVPKTTAENVGAFLAANFASAL